MTNLCIILAKTQENLHGVLVVNILEKFQLPVSCAYSAESLYHAALSDKKRKGSMVNLIIPERIGSCRIVPTPVDELLHFIESGL